MNKILKGGIFLTIAAGVFALLGFVGSLRSISVCEALEVHNRHAEVQLVSERDVRERTTQGELTPVGQPLGELDTRSMEEAIAKIPHVKDVVVYKTIDSKLVVELRERQPIARLIDRSGLNALLDIEGVLLPLSKNANLRLPVVTGSFDLPDLASESNLISVDNQQNSALKDIYHYVSTVQKDLFWNLQLQHTEYTQKGEFVVHPQVGNHTILFGNTDRLEEKLHTLRIFYKEGMNEARWNKYASINLKYKDQIVCTKK